MTLDEWAGHYDGEHAMACELLGCHDTMYVLNLPGQSGYLILNATTSVVSRAGYGDLALDGYLPCDVRPLDVHEAVTPC